MDTKYLQIYVDDEHFGILAADISVIRKNMVKRMQSNESPTPIDFDIDHLFEV